MFSTKKKVGNKLYIGQSEEPRSEENRDGMSTREVAQEHLVGLWDMASHIGYVYTELSNAAT